MHQRSPLLSGDIQAVLFDLDGTLVDTAPDMVAVLFRLMEKHGVAPIDFQLARNNVSNGAAGLLRTGFPGISNNRLQELIADYLEDYAANLCSESAVFEPLEDLLTAIQDADSKWGVVTNKPERMTHPLMQALGISSNAACIVCGDTLDQRKPHPAPMLHAAELVGLPAENIVYVGDASRDIDAGSRAGMQTVAVGYGYIETHDDPQSWGATAYVADTIELDRLLRSSLSLDD